MVELDGPQMKIWRKRFACWLIEATDTHTHPEYVIFIAFSQQEWLRERTSLSHCFSCFVHACVRAYVRTYVHTHTYKHTHTYT